MCEVSRVSEKIDARDVLDAFIKACPVPTPTQVSTWVKAHPEHAEAIKEAAADLLAVNLLAGDGDRSAPSESDLQTDFERTAKMAGLDSTAMPVSELVDLTGLDLPIVAERLDIGVDVLVALEEGMINTAPPKRFVAAFATIVTMPQRTVREAIAASRETPRMAMAAKMGPAATVTAKSWTEVVKASSMRTERKDFWLADD